MMFFSILLGLKVFTLMSVSDNREDFEKLLEKSKS